MSSVVIKQNDTCTVIAGEIPQPSLWKILGTALLFLVTALALFGALINRPPSYVFDEGLYVEGARSILAGNGILNPEHPPLAKLFFAGGVAIAGDNPIGWRLAGVVCGAVTVAAIFLWVWVLLGDYSLAVTAALLTLFNNFQFVMARTTMLDVPMFMFAMCGLLAFTAALELEIGISWRRALVAISGTMFGLAGACKWTAVNTFGTVVLITVLLLLVGRFAGESAGDNLKRQIRNLQNIGVPALCFGLLLAPAVTYSLAFIPVFVTTHTPFSLGELVRIQIRMLTLSKGVAGNKCIYSPWYRWPFMASPLRGLSYLLGNVVVMWGGVVAVAICCRRLLKSIALAESLVVFLFVLNLLQWVVTPRPVTFYYYYYPSAMFLGTALAVALRGTARPQIFGVRLAVILPVLAAVFFLYCYPRMAHLDAPWDCMFGCWN